MKISKILIYSTLLICIFCSECTVKTSPSTDEDCNGLQVEDNNKVCAKVGDICDETDVCTNVKYGATEQICSKLKVSADKEATHVCSKNSAEGSTNCIETNECEKVLYVKNDADCSKFTVSTANTDTHTCIKNPDGDNCMEKAKDCEQVTVDATDAICSKLTVSTANTNTHACIKNPAGTNCKETDVCEQVTFGATDAICSKLTVSTANTNTHTCIKNPQGTNCMEKAKDCGNVPGEITDEVCSKLTATSPNICVKESNTCTVTNICSKATYVKSDDLCKQLTPLDNQHTCIKDSTGNGCTNIFYCEYASGNSDEECKKYPVKSEGSECKKKTGENKCEEKASHPDGEGDTKTTGDADTKTTGDADTKTTGDADTKTTGETGPTQGTETDLNKDNKGMLLNLSLYTLLIYFLF